jgi:hypothetical protein
MSVMETTILVKKSTRDLLREIGRKNQTYDDLINELIQNKNVGPIMTRATTRTTDPNQHQEINPNANEER